MKVLVSRPIPPAALERLRAAGHEVVLPERDAPLDAARLRGLLAGCTALIAMLTDRIDGDLLDDVPGLRIVVNYAVGFNNIDVPEATRRGVLIANTPDVLTDATADLAWALLLAAARRVGEGERLLRAGQWDGWGPLQFLGSHVTGKTLGIIGPGRIGQATAERARGFRMRVLYAGRRPSPTFEAATGGTHVPLEQLLHESDFVSLHCPLTPETRHLLSAARLRSMKPGAVLVNTARGPVVDEAALVEVLRDGPLAAAGLDVFEAEPAIHPGLLELENAVLLPHIGSASRETRDAMAHLCVDNVLAFAEGRRPPTLLNPPAWDARA